ncbi:MAG: ISL3 family transposase [Clostridia bacterium]|nr:ISL3 family transposase [Clostridia bacterium]
MSNYSRKMFRFKELNVKEIKNYEMETILKVEMPVKKHICPWCSKTTQMIHDYLPERKIKDIPFGKIKTTLIYKPRRYHCTCGKNFLENCEEIIPRYKMTKRFIDLIIEETRSLKSFKSIANDLGVSPTTVIRIFDNIEYEQGNIGEIVCIDEFKGNLGGQKYQAVMVDPQTSKITNMHRNRYKWELNNVFKEIPKQERYKVKFFICDMWDSYIELAQHFFPKAEIIVDRFHYTRYVTKAMNDIRVEIQKTVGKDLRVHMKHSRALLLGRNEKVLKIDKYDARTQLYEMLNLSPKLTTAYQLEQAWYKVNDSKDRMEAKINMYRFYDLVASSNLKEFQSVVETFKNYEKYILNSFLTKYTNSYAEGVNTLIKTFKRIGFGYRNLRRFRNRIMHYQNA